MRKGVWVVLGRRLSATLRLEPRLLSNNAVIQMTPAILGLIIAVLIPAGISLILGILEILVAELFLEGLAKRIFTKTDESYFFEIITAVPAIKGLSLCFAGLALHFNIFFGYRHVARIFESIVQQAGLGDITHQTVTAFMAVLLAAGFVSLLIALGFAQNIYMVSISETISILNRVSNNEDTRIVLRDSHTLGHQRKRRGAIIFLGVLTIAFPLIMIFLIVRAGGG